MNANKPAAIEMMKKFYAQGGVSISDASMNKEFDTRPTYTLTRQLAAMDRARGGSEMDGWFDQIATFMRGTGALQSLPAAKEYVTDDYLKRVQADARLREFANNSK
jgi:NitT/TauT family transport system substrate-binding protein